MNQPSFGSLKYYDKHRHATWLELFFDLVFVAGIASSAHILSHVHDGHIVWSDFPKFALSFAPLWWIWATHTYFANRFDTDTRSMRLPTLFIMLLFILMATLFNNHLLDHYKFKWFVLFYFLIRCVQAIKYFYVSKFDTQVSNNTKYMSMLIFVGATVCASTIFVSVPYRVPLFLSVILLEVLGTYLITKFTKIMHVHQEHLVERIGLLSIILLGESIIALVAGIKDASWNTVSVLNAVNAFCLIGFMWWIYFDSFPYLERAKRFGQGFALLFSHFFFCVGLAVLASVILLTIKANIGLQDFRYMVILGMTLFYIGKQWSYFVYFPTYRINNIVNTVACIGFSVLSVYVLPQQYALIGITLAMAGYTFSNLYWTLKKDASAYLKT